MEKVLTIDRLNISYKSIQPFSIKKNILSNNNKKIKIIHALDDVSFEAYKGEVIGIVGRNGSGKSTLLKAIANVFSPDSGSICTYGNTVSLLAIGNCFVKDISGRDNIYLYGMLYGLSEKCINERMNDIVSFSELENFIDMPVQTYSSGMVSKLAFSIATQLNVDILLVDELLSVGDSKFRKKSYAKMRDLINDSDRTVMIVSHQDETLRELCDRVIWLNKGKIIEIGEASEVLDKYMDSIK